MGQLASSLGLRHHFLGCGWGKEAGGGSLEGLGAPGRQEGMGRAWLGPQAWRGQPSGVCPRDPPLPWGPRGRFSSRLRNTARRIFRVGLGPGLGGRRGGAEEALLMLLCLADFQGADDAIDVFFWYLRGVGSRHP